MMLHLTRVSEIKIEHLISVTRNGFKEKNALTLERIQRRALSSEQYSDLYAMMAEEWQCHLERESNPNRKVNLPALVACWHAFNDGVRHVEINTLTVSDV